MASLKRLIKDPFRTATDALGLTDYKQAGKDRKLARDIAAEQRDMGREMYDYWMENMAPYQQDLMRRQSQLYDDASLTDADYDRAIGAATTDVSSAFNRQRDAQTRDMQRYGLNPSSGRYQGADRQMDIAEALGRAQAANSTRQGLKNQEFGQKSQALGLGGHMAGFAGGASGLGMSGIGNSGAMTQNLFGQHYGHSMNAMGRVQTQQHDMANNFWFGGSSGGGGAFGMMMGGMADGKQVGLLSRAKNELAGEVRGPGTPVSDSITVPHQSGGNVALADGEVVLPTDTVAAMGKEAFDRDPQSAAMQLGQIIAQETGNANATQEQMFMAGMAAVRQNPDAAFHALGVALSESKIDQTHVPAEIQRQHGLSADPRGVQKGYADGGGIGLLGGMRDDEPASVNLEVGAKEKTTEEDGSKPNDYWGPSTSSTYIPTIINDTPLPGISQGLSMGPGAYADGGQVQPTHWENLRNAFSGGRYAANQERRRQREIEEEERAWLREQREQQRQFQAGLADVHRNASSNRHQGQDLNDPEFGLLAAYGNEKGAKLGLGLRDEKPFDHGQAREGILSLMAKHAPEKYLGLTAGSKESADWRLTSLGDGRFVMYNQRTGERRLPTKGELASVGATDKGGPDGRAMKPATMSEMRQHYLLDAGLSEERILLASQQEGGLQSLIEEIGAAGKFGEWAADNYGIDVYSGQPLEGWVSPLQRQAKPSEGVDRRATFEAAAHAINNGADPATVLARLRENGMDDLADNIQQQLQAHQEQAQQPPRSHSAPAREMPHAPSRDQLRNAKIALDDAKRRADDGRMSPQAAAFEMDRLRTLRENNVIPRGWNAYKISQLEHQLKGLFEQ